MCKDRGQACNDCRHNGETRDCPNFKQKVSCIACGAVGYENEMVLIDTNMYACEMCATEIIHGMELSYEPKKHKNKAK